jgi:4-diphosphocytidyl-2-C-methyl-D-erythritol kinase
MSAGPTRARVEALAKINLGLRVLHQRADGYHELRTVFQTISLTDLLDVEFQPGRRTGFELRSDVAIEDNLVLRAARLAMDAMKRTGTVTLRLQKRIPVGAGLGGGSSDAAAVLLALPVLAGKRLPATVLLRLAGELGSDVPFFLYGGTALGIGRGTEVYPLPDLPRSRGLLVAPDIHVSTAEAYRALGRRLTLAAPTNKISSFQSYVWGGTTGASGEDRRAPVGNDFEEAVFSRHPRLKAVKKELSKLGADPVMLTGSGSAIFGIFRTREELRAALPSFQKERVFLFRFVSRAAYRARWWRRLGAHLNEESWPPKSRTAR